VDLCSSPTPTALGNVGASSITIANGAELQVGVAGNILDYTSYPLTLQGIARPQLGVPQRRRQTHVARPGHALRPPRSTRRTNATLTLRGGINIGRATRVETGGRAHVSTFTVGTTGISGTGSLVVDGGFTGGVTILAASTFTGRRPSAAARSTLLNSQALGRRIARRTTGISVAADAALQLTNDALSENPAR